MPSYKVQQGDHLSALAEKHGFRELKTIWDHPQNAALKAQRKNPHILLPGDDLFIPDKEDKKAAGPTSKTHKFEVKTEKLKLKLLFHDVNSKPRANEDCTIDIEGAETKEKTGGDGTITKTIPRSAKVAKASLGNLDIPMLIGHLDPVESKSGQIARLANLGYEPGDVDVPDDERLRSAIEEFQCDQSLPVDGICGADTQAKLKDVHGC
jgi:N-acetylmuramoyl-L-alanine amidase